jgi:hypothetical protein
VFSKKHCGIALVVVGASVGVPRVALAAPSVSALASGDCPNQHQLEVALLARGLKVGDSKFVVSTAASGGHVELNLLRASGESLLTRRFSSEDCIAAADAAAVVVEAYFIEVGGGKLDAAPIAGASQRAPVASPIRESVSERGGEVESNRARSAPLPASVSAADRAAVPVGGLVYGPVPSRVVVAPGRADSPRPIGYFAVGTGIGLPDGAVTARLEGGAGVEWRRLPLSAELSLATSLPNTSGDTPARVRRWANQGVVRVGVPFGGHPRYRPWIGVGGTLAQLRALDVESAPTRSSASALVGAGLELAWPIANSWSGRLDLSCLVLASRDSYRVQPDGEIGRGPRVVCATLVGLAIGSGSGTAR